MNISVDELAQEIRRVDGSNSLGAGALAEALTPFLSSRLSAASAPEGGAVDVTLFDLAWKMVEAIRGGGTPPFLTPEEAANKAAPYLIERLAERNALATSEEAQAEAGDRALELKERIDQLMDERHFPAHLFDTCEELKDIAEELSALHAQPPAREDAQPYGWTIQGSNAIFVSEKVAEARIAKWRRGKGPIALYTHPTPDALRVAVEALGRGISRCESYERINLHGTTQSARKAGTLRNALFDMRQALAALQAEQVAETGNERKGWDHRYRPLSEGEIILATDEVQYDDGTWHLASSVGLPAPSTDYSSHRVYRRFKQEPVACAKCGMFSGNDWKQCSAPCPMPESPYYVREEVVVWFKHEGGPNPAPGKRIDVKMTFVSADNVDADIFDWNGPCLWRIHTGEK